MTVLVTGQPELALAIAVQLEASGRPVRRIDADGVPGGLGPYANWCSALDGVDTVVHAAELAVDDPATVPEPDADFDWINAEGTLWLAEQAARAAVRRFVLLSSAEVVAGAPPGTTGDGWVPEPAGDYARSKWRAERHVMETAFLHRFEPVILRPTIVLGPDPAEPAAALVGAIRDGARVPAREGQALLAPLGVDDLAAAVALAVSSPGAAGLQAALAGPAGITLAALAERLRPVPTPRLRRATLRERLVLARLAAVPALQPRAMADATGWRPSRFAVSPPSLGVAGGPGGSAEPAPRT